MKVENISGAFIAALIGFGTGLLALITQDGVSQLADIGQIAWVVLAIGSGISFLKDYQALSTRRLISKMTGNGVNSPLIVGVLAALLVLFAVSGCSGTRQAYQGAEGLDETAKVFAEHYFGLVHKANTLKKSGHLAGQDLVIAENIVRKTAPVVFKLSAAAEAYKAFRSADNEAAFERAIGDAAVAISTLIDVFKGSGVTNARFNDKPSLSDMRELLAAT